MSSATYLPQLLCPLPEAPIIPCVGLNYQHHATEAKVVSKEGCPFSQISWLTFEGQASIPKHPVVFSKPSTALAGPYEDVHVHPEVQKMVDYEGELTVVIGRAAKNVQAEDALDYVLGFTAGNDVSARDYQGPIEVSGGQFSYAKSFDTFAPIGPCITSTKLIPDPQALNYVTRVNGEIRQQTSTSDMIWSVKQIIEHLSRGTTLLPGTCIMTGTPSGVGVWMVPPKFLKHGDVVEVEIEKIGMIRNKMVFG